MKKTILLTLALLVSVSCSEAFAKSKKNVKKLEIIPAPVELKNLDDSLSYAVGQARTQGLMDFVSGSLGVDSLHINDFKAGLKAGLEAATTPEAKAYLAGQYIALMAACQMPDQLNKQLVTYNKAIDIDLFKRGFTDAVDGDASVLSVDEAASFYQNQMQALAEAETAKKKAEGQMWLEANKKLEGVKTTESGLQYKVIRQGEGPVATRNADVEVKYEGKLINGMVFDSSYKRDPQTTTFKPSQVIKGWTEALCMMPEGSEWELYIPENLGYGSRDTAQIPAYSTLIFRVEVVKVTPEKTEEPAKEEAPAAKKATPAKKTVAKKPAAKKVAKK